MRNNVKKLFYIQICLIVSAGCTNNLPQALDTMSNMKESKATTLPLPKEEPTSKPALTPEERELLRESARQCLLLAQKSDQPAIFVEFIHNDLKKADLKPEDIGTTEDELNLLVHPRPLNKIPWYLRQLDYAARYA